MTAPVRFFLLLLLLVSIGIGLVLIMPLRQGAPPKQRAGSTPSVVPGPSSESAPPAAPSLGRGTITESASVDIKNFSFTPAVLRVKRGALVTWVNLDSDPHTVTGVGFDSSALPQSGVWSHQFKVLGRYEYGCSIHPQMKGVIEVR